MGSGRRCRSDVRHTDKAGSLITMGGLPEARKWTCASARLRLILCVSSTHLLIVANVCEEDGHVWLRVLASVCWCVSSTVGHGEALAS